MRRIICRNPYLPVLCVIQRKRVWHPNMLRHEQRLSRPGPQLFRKNSYYSVVTAKYLLVKNLERSDWLARVELKVLGRKAPAELLEIGTYSSAAHHTADNIEVVGVGHVLHPRGHPPADGGVREFKSLFVERIVLGIRHCGSIPLILKRERGRERGGPRVYKLVKSRYLNIVYFGFGK